MSMQDLPDNELDKLFRKSAEEFEPQFNPQAWNAMRQKLDDEDGKVGGIPWKKVGIVAVLLLILGFGGYYLLDNQTPTISKTGPTEGYSHVHGKASNEMIKINPKENIILKSSQRNDEATATSLPKKGDKVNKSKPSKESLLAHNQPITQNISSLNKPLKEANVSVKYTSKSKKSNKGILSYSSSDNLSFSNKFKKQSRLPLVLKRTASAQKTVTNSNSTDLLGINRSTNTPLIEGINVENSRFTPLTPRLLPTKEWKLLQLSLPILSVVYNPPSSPLFIPKKEDPSSFFRKGLGIRATIAPDLSYITMNQMMQQPTLAVGVLIDYRFSRRWSLQTGVLRSIKLYHATGEQYKWPVTWNKQAARPIDVSAECKIIDLPINLRYDISQGMRHRWFVSSGLSSYVLLNEKYDYTYDPQATNIKWKTWEGTTGNSWFGIMNISLGLERRIGQNLSIQAEPYLKIPLAQLGMGKVMLNTSGIYISARYRLGRF